MQNGKAGCRVAGLKWNRGRSSKFKWRQKGSQFSSQAGVGAEYVEGWETTVNFSCYKCGLRGHIARNCPSQDGIPNCAMKDDQGTSFQIKESNFQEPLDTIESQEVVDKSEHELTIFLKSQFHHDSFRGLQLPTIQLILRGESCLSIMATGQCQ